jgi:hypothetical protein
VPSARRRFCFLQSQRIQTSDLQSPTVRPIVDHRKRKALALQSRHVVAGITSKGLQRCCQLLAGRFLPSILGAAKIAMYTLPCAVRGEICHEHSGIGSG